MESPISFQRMPASNFTISDKSATVRIVAFSAHGVTQSVVSIAWLGAVIWSPEYGARISYPRCCTQTTYAMLIVFIFICLLFLFMANKFLYFAHGENGREPNVFCFFAEHCSGLQVCTRTRAHKLSERSSKIFYALPHSLYGPKYDLYDLFTNTPHMFHSIPSFIELISLFYPLYVEQWKTCTIRQKIQFDYIEIRNVCCWRWRSRENGVTMIS